MRLFLLVIFAAFAATSAEADQTDSRLDELFVELRTGDGLSAEETAGRILAIWDDSQSDTVDVLFARAQASADAGEFDLAESLLGHVIGLSPNFAQGFAMRGAVRLAQQNPAGALADLEKTIILEPRQFEARVALAEIMLVSEAEREAYDMLQKALEWNPHQERARNLARRLRRDLDGQEI